MRDRFVFRYQVTEDHLRPAAQWILWHRYGRGFWIRVVALIGMATCTYFVWKDPGAVTLRYFFLVVSIGLVVVLALFHPRGTKVLTKTKLLGMEQVATIDRGGIEVSGQGFCSKSDWSLMWQVVALDRGLIVQPNPGSYWWLPFDKVEGEFRKEELGVLLAKLPVQVRG